MNATFQTVTALVIVGIAATWLVWRAWSKRKKPGCGDNCACPADEFKKRLKR
ncbi:FeoB-associated Cys-rich membrane protein [Ereboglobus luteus]|uniref:FeoB-associated Cys-rich membrane protein n=1 Tax=Ereboglobus luteus TaxID=1796921 RepID=UPI000D550AAA|nr:FeoB-associated Cys-rich membrane protein [Ereboglobus luteus]